VNRTARWLLVFLLVFAAALGRAETLLAEATVVDVSARGFVLRIGGETVPTEDESRTRYWFANAPAERTAFHIGDTVGVRIKTDASPAILREMADARTWRWLTRVRKETLPASVVRVEAKSLTVRFDDGTTFTYRTSDKSEVRRGGMVARLSDVPVGTRLYAKGRLRSNLDTWLVSLSDERPAAKPEGTRRGTRKGSTPFTLAASGRLRGTVARVLFSVRMVQVRLDERPLYVTYDNQTAFTLEGRKVRPTEMRMGQTIHVAYKRDRFGRLVATKVELFQAG
jgi:hypothetical protein